jgi:hypothetical protein
MLPFKKVVSNEEPLMLWHLPWPKGKKPQRLVRDCLFTLSTPIQ